jgi:hypothetical protein
MFRHKQLNILVQHEPIFSRKAATRWSIRIGFVFNMLLLNMFFLALYNF